MEENQVEEIIEPVKCVPLEPIYDDIICDDETNNSSNLDLQYTEELDFSNLKEELEKEEFKNIELDENATEKLYSENLNSDSVKFEQVEPKKSANIVYNERPSLKISLVNNIEEEEEISSKDIKIDIKGNDSLFKVLFIGCIILMAILFLPSLAISLI